MKISTRTEYGIRVLVTLAREAGSGPLSLAGIAKAEKRAGREAIVFVTTDAAESVEGLSEGEHFVWPRDEDRLIMAFMTGA